MYVQANAELGKESRMLSDRVKELTKSNQETRMLLGDKEESCGMLAGKEYSLNSYFKPFTMYEIIILLILLLS